MYTLIYYLYVLINNVETPYLVF